MATWLRHNNDYRIADPNNRVKQCNGQNITQPNSSGYGVMSTNVDGGAGVGMRSTSNLTNVILPRNYEDDNSYTIGGDVSPIVFVNLGGGSNGDITDTDGFATFNSDGLSIEVGDCIKFDTTTPYSGAYRVLSNDGVSCVFNAAYVSTTGQIGAVYKQSGAIDQQSNRYLMRGNAGIEMRRDRVHQVQQAVLDNSISLTRSGYYSYPSGQFTVPLTYSDRWPSFKISGGVTGLDKSVEPHGLSVGGGYSMHLGIEGIRGVIRGRHDGKNETR